MTEVLNPDKLSTRVNDLSNRLARGVEEVTRRQQDYVDRAREYDHAYARAFRAADGPEYGKKYSAELDTTEQRRLMDAAKVMFDYAQRQARRLELELSATQSLLKSVVSMYHGAGVGHGG